VEVTGRKRTLFRNAIILRQTRLKILIFICLLPPLYTSYKHVTKSSSNVDALPKKLPSLKENGQAKTAQ